jgi:hypothetical protein
LKAKERDYWGKGKEKQSRVFSNTFDLRCQNILKFSLSIVKFQLYKSKQFRENRYYRTHLVINILKSERPNIFEIEIRRQKKAIQGRITLETMPYFANTFILPCYNFSNLFMWIVIGYLNSRFISMTIIDSYLNVINHMLYICHLKIPFMLTHWNRYHHYHTLSQFNSYDG